MCEIFECQNIGWKIAQFVNSMHFARKGLFRCSFCILPSTQYVFAHARYHETNLSKGLSPQMFLVSPCSFLFQFHFNPVLYICICD